MLWPAGQHGVDGRFYAVAESEDETEGGADSSGVLPTRYGRRDEHREVEVPSVDVDVEGVNHALHETRTDMATRGLIRALADDPGTALSAVVARLFTVLVLEAARSPEASALSITAQGYRKPRHDPVEALDGEVRARLAERRAAYGASGLRPIPWVAELPHGEKMALLAELAAVSLDLREAKTDSLRPAARADAADIAALTSADITAFWTPDEAFLKEHGKKHLLAMLVAMDVSDDRARTLKKDELVAFVAERAAERSWAPDVLAWTAPVEEEPTSEDNAAPDDPGEPAAGEALPAAA